MSRGDPQLQKPVWWRRKWVTVSEVIGVGALAVAVLGFFDSHKVHRQELADRAAAQSQAARREALVLRGEPVDNGARILLHPVRSEQAIQSQRYLFPRAVLGHAMQVDAEPPQLQVAWVDDGLRAALAEAGRTGGRTTGFGRLPVGVVTTYVEDGETRTDRSLYLVGFKATHGGLFGGGPRFAFQGLELVSRAVGGDLQARVNLQWRRAGGLA